jgi:hypothetical protein
VLKGKQDCFANFVEVIPHALTGKSRAFPGLAATCVCGSWAVAGCAEGLLHGEMPDSWRSEAAFKRTQRSSSNIDCEGYSVQSGRAYLALRGRICGLMQISISRRRVKS